MEDTRHKSLFKFSTTILFLIFSFFTSIFFLPHFSVFMAQIARYYRHKNRKMELKISLNKETSKI